jgi:histidinol phosphatase-like PHP family hydrolase
MNCRVTILRICIIAISCFCQPTLANNEWIDLFDGKTLDGWRASENQGTFQVEDGIIVANGTRSHLFYEGNVNNHSFKNFELIAEVKTLPLANSGIFFHTEYQEQGWPGKGFEVQINNSHLGEGNYRELKKTGSLYSIRNQYKSIVDDNEWFSMHIIVKGRRVQVKLNDVLVTDYIEPKEPVSINKRPGRRLSSGTFALQGHDPKSTTYFKSIKVKPLPDDIDADIPVEPVVDETYKTIVQLNAANFPIVDHHVHLKGTLTLEDALQKSRDEGIYYGIAPNCGIGFPITDDAGIYEFVKEMKDQPIFLGMQAEGREWVNTFSKEARDQFDYVFSDSLTFTNHKGNRMRIWIPEEVEFETEQQFMDMYVKSIVSVISNEPIDIFVNPTFLPQVIADKYDELWTEERMMKVIKAAVKSNVAIEINARYEIPSAAFIKLAKKHGVKFAFGTNNGDENFGRLEYCLKMMKECDLKASDMFLPKKHDVRLIQD